MNSPGHLELIQGVIERLAGNSFAYKGWAVTVAAGIVAFMITRTSGTPVAGLYPVIAFWILDSQSLSLERTYRKLYEEARLGKVADYSLDIGPIHRPILDQLNAMTATSILIFYGTAAVAILIVDSIY